MTDITKSRIRDESGIALPLAVIMVVLVGVMGAGLLTFVVTDLRSVLEVNQGQKALEMADAGVKVAKMQLVDKPFPNNYSTSSDWHPDYGGVGSGGKSITMDGNRVRVTIRPAPGSTAAQPFFEVTSDSTVGQARRKVHAIFKAAGWGAKAYFTKGSIYIGPDSNPNESLAGKLLDRVDIRGVSLFSEQDVIIEDNTSITYRKKGTTTTGTDSIIGGGYRGQTTGSSPYCIYQDNPAGSDDYQSAYDSSKGATCIPLFNNYQAERTWANGTLPYASAVEQLTAPASLTTAAPPQPHIRIVGNAECPELYDQWVGGAGGGKPFAVDPDFHEDALGTSGNWVVEPFNTVARPPDAAQTIASCQDGTDSNLEPYPSTRRYVPAGIAAEGKICRASQDDPSTRRCLPSATSLTSTIVGDIRGGAERIGYDGSTLSSGTGFYDKYDAGSTAAGPVPSGRTNDISYPFDNRQKPDTPGLLSIAQNQPSTSASGSVIRSSRYVNLEGSNSTLLNSASGWDQFYPADNRNPETVVFIDANGKDLELPNDPNPKQGILVVRCGNLTNMDNYKGIIVLLTDVGPGDSAATCNTKGNYRTGKPGMNYTIDTDGYVYAEGVGDPSSSDGSDAGTEPDYAYGIYIADGSNVDRLGKNYLGLQPIVGSGIQGVELESWRECYNVACN